MPNEDPAALTCDPAQKSKSTPLPPATRSTSIGDTADAPTRCVILMMAPSLDSTPTLDRSDTVNTFVPETTGLLCNIPRTLNRGTISQSGAPPPGNPRIGAAAPVSPPVTVSTALLAELERGREGVSGGRREHAYAHAHSEGGKRSTQEREVERV